MNLIRIAYYPRLPAKRLYYDHPEVDMQEIKTNSWFVKPDAKTCIFKHMSNQNTKEGGILTS